MSKLAHRRGHAFEATPRNGAAQVGVWDQLAALSNEYYSKEGRLSLINEQSARVGLQNFREQKNNLIATIGHDFRDGAADYNALALLVDGAIVDVASHDPVLPPPTLDMLPRGDDGSPPDDGVYCYRCYISPLGQEKSALYRYISPEFFNDGELPNGKRIGLQFTGLCWTNRPFLDGVEKQRYERGTAARSAQYMERGDSDSSVVVMLVPDERIAADLAVEGGEKASELHCTVLYLGKSSGMTPAREMALHGAVSVLASGFRPLEGRIAGAGRFVNEDKEVFVALVDAPELPWLRESLIKKLSDAGIWQLQQDHGFNPHITLKYVDAAETTPSRIDPIDLKFKGITVAIGGTWTTYDFLGAQAFAMENRMNPAKMDTAPAGTQSAPPPMDPAMMAKCMEEAGITPADDEATKMMKMAMYSQKMKMSAAPPMPPKKEGEAEAAGAKKPDMAAARVEPSPPADLPAAASPAPAPAGGSPDIMVPGDPGLQPAGPGMAGDGGNYMSRLHAMERQAAADRAKLVQLEADAKLRANAERKADAQLFAFEAFRKGQIPMRGSETPATAQERIASLYTAKGKEAAEAALADPGTEKRVPENVMMTFSKDGTPHGGGFQGGGAASTNPGQELHRITMERMTTEKTVGQRGAYSRTARQVAMERQDLSSAWSRGVGVHPTAAPRQ